MRVRVKYCWRCIAPAGAVKGEAFLLHALSS
jgi:hypothetical protein